LLILNCLSFRVQQSGVHGSASGSKPTFRLETSRTIWASTKNSFDNHFFQKISFAADSAVALRGVDNPALPLLLFLP
jgi:hypothetical protein